MRGGRDLRPAGFAICRGLDSKQRRVALASSARIQICKHQLSILIGDDRCIGNGSIQCLYNTCDCQVNQLLAGIIDVQSSMLQSQQAPIVDDYADNGLCKI